MIVFCYAAKVWKMLKISKMDVLKISVLLTASPLRGSMRGGWHRALTCATAWLVTHRFAPAGAEADMIHHVAARLCYFGRRVNNLVVR